MRVYRNACGAALALLLGACGSGGDTPVAPSPTLQFVASPPALRAGEALTLLWSTRDAAACQASGNWSGARGTAGSETLYPLAGSSTYVLECSGAGGRLRRSLSVNVTALPVAPTLNFTVTPAEVPQGTPATLSWLAQDAASCVAAGDWSGARLSGGTQVVTPAAGEHDYELVCSGPGGSIGASVRLRVLPLPPADAAAVQEFERVQTLERGCCEATQ